jgi:AraC-like DNA-binding protein/TolB-like protein
MLYREYGTIERLEHSIDAHLNDSEFSIDLLCKEVGISRSQLHRIIKEKTNLSITLYLRKKRLEKAKLLLSSTDLRVSEIADAVGINNPANFSKYFIEEFQMSPTDFRKQQQTDLTEVLTVIPPLHHQQEDWVKNPPGRKPNLPSRYVYVLVGIAAILAVAFYFFGYRFSNESIQNSTSLQEVSENTIAILPFKNLGPTEKSFFSDGVMEQIHASLSLLENLKVISKSSSKLFRDSPKPLSQIANELHVKYILEGSVLQIDQKIRITVELSNAAAKLRWRNQRGLYFYEQSG